MSENAKVGTLILGYTLLVLVGIALTVGTVYRDKITSGMVKILSQEIVTKDYLLTQAVERLEVINYEDDHLTNDLIQTIKKALK